MSSNLQKAFLSTSALYILAGALIATSISSISQQNRQEASTRMCLACFQENKPRTIQQEEQKKEVKKIEKQPQKRVIEQATDTPIKTESKQTLTSTQNTVYQTPKTQEIVNTQKQYNDLNGKKIREILVKHANNSYAQKARNNGVTGICKVSFVLHPDGTVSDKDISDCHMWLKSSAKIAIEDAASEFPRPHDNCKITTSIDYEILRG